MIAPGTVLQSRYRIICQLGAGGMGTVYEAIDERLDTTVALKETHFSDERLSKQFEREARLLARLHHQALPKVIDHFSDGNGQFLVMNFISGEDLFEMLRKRGKPFLVNEVLTWGDQLLDALNYLHNQDPPIIHRDIKPQNLKLTSQGQIILLDFGLAKGFKSQGSHISTSDSIFGFTPNYAPLEQIQGTGTDPRSDLYSLAATLYHLLTGTPPPRVLDRLKATTDDQPDPLRSIRELNPQVNLNVASVLRKAMFISSNHRFGSAAEMRKALHSAKQPSTSAVEDLAETRLPSTVVYHSKPTTQGLNPKIAPDTIASSDKPLLISDIEHKPSVESFSPPSRWGNNLLLYIGIVVLIMLAGSVAVLLFISGNKEAAKSESPTPTSPKPSPFISTQVTNANNVINGKWSSKDAQQLVMKQLDEHEAQNKFKFQKNSTDQTGEDKSNPKDFDLTHTFLGEFYVPYRNRETMVIATASNYESNNCHACAPSLSFFELVKNESGWATGSVNIDAFDWGSWGEFNPEDMKVLAVGDNIYGVVLESGYTAQGVVDIATAIYVQIGDEFREVFQINTSHNDGGAGMHATNSAWDSEIIFRKEGVGFYDFLLIRKGTKDSKKFVEEELYKFDGKKYSLSNFK